MLGCGLFCISGVVTAFTLAGYVFVPTDFGTGRSLCGSCFEIVVVGIDRNGQIGNSRVASFIGEVLGAIRAGPVFNGAGGYTGCIDLFMMNLVLMVDGCDFFVTGDINLTIRAVNACGVTHCGAGFFDGCVVFGVDVVVQIVTDFFGLGMACVIFAGVGLDAHLMATGNGCNGAFIPLMCFGVNGNGQIGDFVCASLFGEVLAAIRTGPVFDGAGRGTGGFHSFVVNLVLVCDCRNFFVTGDPLVTVFAECACGVADCQTGGIRLCMVGCVDVVAAVDGNGQVSKFCLFCIKVLVADRALVVTLDTFFNTGCRNFCDPCAVVVAVGNNRFGVGCTAFGSGTGKGLDAFAFAGGIGGDCTLIPGVGNCFVLDTAVFTRTGLIVGIVLAVAVGGECFTPCVAKHIDLCAVFYDHIALCATYIPGVTVCCTGCSCFIGGDSFCADMITDECIAAFAVAIAVVVIIDMVEGCNVFGVSVACIVLTGVSHNTLFGAGGSLGFSTFVIVTECVDLFIGGVVTNRAVFVCVPAEVVAGCSLGLDLGDGVAVFFNFFGVGMAAVILTGVGHNAGFGAGRSLGFNTDIFVTELCYGFGVRIVTDGTGEGLDTVGFTLGFGGDNTAVVTVLAGCGDGFFNGLEIVLTYRTISNYILLAFRTTGGFTGHFFAGIFGVSKLVGRLLCNSDNFTCFAMLTFGKTRCGTGCGNSRIRNKVCVVGAVNCKSLFFGCTAGTGKGDFTGCNAGCIHTCTCHFVCINVCTGCGDDFGYGVKIRITYGTVGNNVLGAGSTAGGFEGHIFAGGFVVRSQCLIGLLYKDFTADRALLAFGLTCYGTGGIRCGKDFFGMRSQRKVYLCAAEFCVTYGAINNGIVGTCNGTGGFNSAFFHSGGFGMCFEFGVLLLY